MESLPNYKEIMLKVSCPRCGAPAGKMCTTLRMATPEDRKDYHYERKYYAKLKFEVPDTEGL